IGHSNKRRPANTKNVFTLKLTCRPSSNFLSSVPGLEVGVSFLSIDTAKKRSIFTSQKQKLPIIQSNRKQHPVIAKTPASRMTCDPRKLDHFVIFNEILEKVVFRCFFQQKKRGSAGCPFCQAS